MAEQNTPKMTHDEMIDALKGLVFGTFDRTIAKEREALDMAIKALEQEPKTGHWIMSDDGLYRPICDKCGAHPWKGYIPTVEEATEVFKYCPNCGARMFEPQESEEV